MTVPCQPGATLETERLILRLPQVQDFDDYAGLLADEQAAHYIGGHQPRAAAWRKFLQMPGAWAIQGFAMFSVVEKSSGRWIGKLGPWHPEGWPGTEVGWAFKRSSWGHGYATEAGTAAIDWAFDPLGWDEVIHSIHPDNCASQRLAQAWVRTIAARASCLRRSKTRRSTCGVRPARTGRHIVSMTFRAINR